eukprot:2920591-Lingulodinium_polyedra.AAC.1
MAARLSMSRVERRSDGFSPSRTIAVSSFCSWVDRPVCSRLGSSGLRFAGARGGGAGVGLPESPPGSR